MGCFYILRPAEILLFSIIEIITECVAKRILAPPLELRQLLKLYLLQTAPGRLVEHHIRFW